MVKLAGCAQGEHFDRPIKGTKRVRCRTCGDEYPCKEESCLHADCRIERGQPLPPWVSSPGYIPTKDLWCPECFATIVPGKPHECAP